MVLNAFLLANYRVSVTDFDAYFYVSMSSTFLQKIINVEFLITKFAFDIYKNELILRTVYAHFGNFF